MNLSAPEKEKDGEYRVVALRYRPQSFGDLIGQNHIATALSNAIKQNRVGHAYLFTGARGVGKTSSARIFAKCLNCEKGPTDTPCNECDICEAVSSGDDVDVLEIDGASNRGIDEIRQLRSNAAVRPSRSRFKIYIIDEVHMLTPQAFNALLKTLEEPPGHVKFIFCTTDPQKIPITVLSRCQRFDFSPVQTDEIANRLREIAEIEGVKADEKALALLARRANGSMRDSQSLLEQLFSFCGDEITVDEVHQLLGTADVGRIAEIAAAMAGGDATAALNLINNGCNEGVNSGQLATQLLGYFRDVMAVRVGCGADTLLTCSDSDLETLTQISEQLGLETVLTIVQILDGAVVRMQSSLHARTLLEVAAVRVSNLENLESISDLVNQLSTGASGAKTTGRPPIRPSAKKKVELKKVSSAPPPKKKEVSDSGGGKLEASTTETNGYATTPPKPKSSRVKDPQRQAETTGALVSTMGGSAPSPATVAQFDQKINASTAPQSASANPAASIPGTSKTIAAVGSGEIEKHWSRTLELVGGMVAEMLSEYEKLDLQDEKLIVTLKDSYNMRECSKPDRKQKVESTLSEIIGRSLRVDFLASQTSESRKSSVPKLTRAQQMRQLHEVDFVKKTMAMFDAEVTNFFQK